MSSRLTLFLGRLRPTKWLGLPVLSEHAPTTYYNGRDYNISVMSSCHPRDGALKIGKYDR